MCGCAGVCNEQNSHGTSWSLCCGLALFSTALASGLWWIQGILQAQCPCSQAQEKVSKGVGSGSSTGLWPLSSLCMCHTWYVFRVPGSYIIKVWNNEVCKIWGLFPIHSKEPPQLFLILITHSCISGLVPCPGINVAWKNLIGWFFFQFICIRMVSWKKSSVQNVHLTVTSFLMFFLLSVQLWSKALCL